MTSPSRIVRACGTNLLAALLACLLLTCAGAGARSNAAAAAPSPAPADPLVVRAIGALDAERNLLAQQPPPGQPLPTSLRDRIREADDRGARLLDQLRSAGYRLSPTVEATLGRLPQPDAAGHPHLPGPTEYQQAIDELEVARPAAAGDDSAGIGATALLVAAVAVLGAIVLILVVAMSRRRHDAHLVELAHSDSLTGLANRRRLDNDLHACRRDRKMPVAVMMVDVDNFKVVNDTHGHAAGDRILQSIGSLLSGQVRSKDVVYRYGGEEFCILLPGASVDEALRVAERICRSTAELVVPVGGHVTVSVGVAIGAAAEVMHTLGQADAALYDAKRDGRNRVVLAPSATARHRHGAALTG